MRPKGVIGSSLMAFSTLDLLLVTVCPTTIFDGLIYLFFYLFASYFNGTLSSLSSVRIFNLFSPNCGSILS